MTAENTMMTENELLLLLVKRDGEFSAGAFDDHVYVNGIRYEGEEAKLIGRMIDHLEVRKLVTTYVDNYAYSGHLTLDGMIEAKRIRDMDKEKFIVRGKSQDGEFTYLVTITRDGGSVWTRNVQGAKRYTSKSGAKNAAARFTEETMAMEGE